jgi:hypothetical protein
VNEINDFLILLLRKVYDLLRNQIFLKVFAPNACVVYLSAKSYSFHQKDYYLLKLNVRNSLNKSKLRSITEVC